MCVYYYCGLFNYFYFLYYHCFLEQHPTIVDPQLCTQKVMVVKIITIKTRKKAVLEFLDPLPNTLTHNGEGW